jgi:hypothetical protein
MKLEQSEAIKDLRSHIMVAYRATDDDEVKKALRNALRALGRAVTPPDPTISELTLAQLRVNLETYR